MTTFIPTSVTACASKAGKTYWKVSTNMGEASCFDYPIVQEIEKSLNKPISLYDLETNEKGFMNIRKAKAQTPVVNPNNMQPVQQKIAQNEDNFTEARKAKDVSIYTSYAKDIFLQLIAAGDIKEASKYMDFALTLVKQAKASFEAN